MQTPKNCLYCGIEFVVTTRNPKKKFCSPTCNNRYRRNDRPIRKRVLCKCERCNKEFEVMKSRARRFCTFECSVNRVPIQSPRKIAPRVTICCEECGQDFIVLLSYYKLRSPRFCSLKCRYQHFTGANNPAYIGGKREQGRGPNWKRQRTLTLKRDGYRCCICGKQKKQARSVEVHHITPYKQFDGDYIAANQLSNLITLCRHCHNNVERRDYPCPVPLL